MTRVVKEGEVCDQTYQGFASRGLQSPFLPVSLSGAHRFFPIITQSFNPGSEDKLYDQTYRGSASRGLQSPFLPVPLRGTPLLSNHNPGFQPWVRRQAL